MARPGYRDDIEGYMAGKHAHIQELLGRSQAWRAQGGAVRPQGGLGR